MTNAMHGSAACATVTSEAAPGPASRLRHIDALRAIAALLVVWLHVSETYVQLDASGRVGGYWLYDIAKSIDAGRIGVVVFFLISGFVIPFSIRPDRTAPVGTFLIKRAFRIYPAYWLSVPLGALTTFWIWGERFSGSDFLINLTLLQDVFGVHDAEGLYWTLLVELVFYVLCVALLLSNSLFNMRRVCALAITFGFGYSLAMLTRWAGAPLMNSTAAFWLLNLSIMLCGTLYRGCVVDGAASSDPWLRASVYGLLFYYIVILPSGAVWAIGFDRNAPVAYALGLLLFIVGTSGLRITTRLTDWLGRISYSIYLFHPVVFMAILWWLLRKPTGSWWRAQHLGVYLIVNAGLTIALAALVYRFVEKPCIRRGHRYADQWARRAGQRRIGAEAFVAASVAVREPIGKLAD